MLKILEGDRSAFKKRRDDVESCIHESQAFTENHGKCLRPNAADNTLVLEESVANVRGELELVAKQLEEATRHIERVVLAMRSKERRQLDIELALSELATRIGAEETLDPKRETENFSPLT